MPDLSGLTDCVVTCFGVVGETIEAVGHSAKTRLRSGNPGLSGQPSQRPGVLSIHLYARRWIEFDRRHGPHAVLSPALATASGVLCSRERREIRDTVAIAPQSRCSGLISGDLWVRLASNLDGKHAVTLGEQS